MSVCLRLGAACVVVLALTAFAGAAEAGPPALGQATNSRVYTLRSPTGYVATIRMRVFRIRRVSQLPPLPFSSRRVLSACQASAQTDGIIPVAVTVTNKTRSFSSLVSLKVVLSYDLTLPATPMYGDSRYSDGAECLPSGNGLAIYSTVWNRPVKPGGSVAADFFIVVPNYLTPRTPRGDRKLLTNACLEAGVSIGVQPNAIELRANQRSGATLSLTKTFRPCLIAGGTDCDTRCEE